jgi:hypothetical protein
MIDLPEAVTAIRRLHDLADCLLGVIQYGGKPDATDVEIISTALLRGVHTLSADEYVLLQDAMERIERRANA